MPRKLEFITQIDAHGQLPKSRLEQIDRHLKLFINKDIQIAMGSPMRSTKANAFYHGFRIRPVRAAMIEAGIGWVEMVDGSVRPVSHEAVHSYFRDKYLEPTIEYVFGEEKVLRPSTTRLDSTEFYWFMEAIKTDEQVLQLDVHFEEPEESYRTYTIEDLPY